MNNALKIRLLRLAQGMKQTDLARASGLPVTTISNIERGAVPQWEQRLLDTLGYTTEMDAMLDSMAAATGNREAAA